MRKNARIPGAAVRAWPGPRVKVPNRQALDEASSVAERVRAIAWSGHPAATRALYAFRTLNLLESNAYVYAASGAMLLRRHLPPLECDDDAYAAVASLPDNDSIVEDNGRIAMPDETLRFRTGSNRDKAVLLDIILEHLGEISWAVVQRETLLTSDQSYVRFGRTLYEVEASRLAETFQGERVTRLGD